LSITYLSFDGALEPLGHSQIVQPLLKLAERGFDIRLLTLERTRAGAGVLQAQLLDAGIRWKSAPLKGTLSNLASLAALALEGKQTQLLHARSLPAAIVALAVQKSLQAKLLFETRVHWARQRRAQGKLPGIQYGIALGLEAAALRRADALVMRTELAAQDLQSENAFCIPPLADEGAFTLQRRQGEAPDGLRAGPLVLGFVGSVNADYLIDATLALWVRIAKQRSEAMFYAVTPQQDALRARLRAIGGSDERVVFSTLPHEEMPRALSWIDWGLMLLRSGERRRASMPKKLGEFLLAGVRPVQHGGNSEVSDWVRRAGTGIALDRLDLDAAAHGILNGQFSSLAEGRQVAMDHFALSSGVERYAAVWNQLLRNTNG